MEFSLLYNMFFSYFEKNNFDTSYIFETENMSYILDSYFQYMNGFQSSKGDFFDYSGMTFEEYLTDQEIVEPTDETYLTFKELILSFPKITSITIEDGITNIGDLAFSDISMEDSSITVSLPDSIIYIGIDAFRNSNINVELPSNSGNLIEIKEGAFEENIGTKVLDIPNTVTTINSDGNGIVAYSYIEELHLPANSTYTTVKMPTWSNYLKKVYIPSNITNINESMLQDWDSLAKPTLYFVGAERTIYNTEDAAINFANYSNLTVVWNYTE